MFISKIAKSILSTKGLVGQFLFHYLFGKGKTMTLPENAQQETKEVLKEAFKAHVKGAMDYHSCVARCGGLEGYKWWEGLAGVIGEFRWSPEFVNGGVIFHCWDRFDFNPTFGELPIPMPKLMADTVIKWGLSKKYIKQSDIDYQALFWTKTKGGTLWITESLIHSLEGIIGTPFLTEWDVFIPNKELEPYELSLLEVDNKGSYLRPKNKPLITDYIEWFRLKGKFISYSYKMREWNMEDKSFPYDKIIK